MPDEIPKQYDPKQTEDKWYKFWEENNLFCAKPNPAKKPFTIVIPPPNVTGILHMGHALNNTLQDILIRYQRMKGREALWMPGTDHAGIATQNVVEKTIAKEGLKRQDLGRQKFIERVWAWKEEYGSSIIHQLKKLGASCAWSRLRFTMDEEYSKAVAEVFVRLYEKDLIYRGSYIINWCPRCQTALSDEEAPHKELQGSLYYLRYPLKKSTVNSQQSTGKTIDYGLSTMDYIVVATTRPETMLGDTAVAVNPKDKRYKHLIGKAVILPLVDREIKIIADSMVDMKFGTGALKVTPAHDPNDYAMGKRHKLEFINIMHPNGILNQYAGEYDGMDRFEAREVILEDLKEKGLLEKTEAHTLSAGHCYRCHTIIEPYLSKQWFVKMRPLAKPAMEAVKQGKIKFYPKRWKKVYLSWMEEIQDWCISRQIWWGHRLPVYYCKKCQEDNCHCEEIPSPVIARPAKQAEAISMTGSEQAAQSQNVIASPSARNDDSFIVSRVKPEKCPACGSTDIYQDEDVLDTWFSSWLWPFVTFYWPFQPSAFSPQPSAKDELIADSRKLKADLDYFYPTSVLVTAPEIIFFWVARMIMAGLEFMQEIPFKDVYIHGTVRDIEGKKMSKSLGNIIDPLEIINEYGTDALRFSLISITAQGQDVFLSKERFEQGRNFANKIWNASRFILMNLDWGLSPKGTVPNQTDLCVFFQKENLSLINRWILSRFYSTLKETEKNLEHYQFNEAANTLYGFFWHEFCDWYLELAKPVLESREQKTENRNTQVVMYKILEKFLRVLHPFMPFISEEIWQKLPHEGASIMMSNWPHIQENIIDHRAEKIMPEVLAVITNIRNMRLELDIPAQAQNVEARIAVPSKSKKIALEALAGQIKNLSRLNKLEILDKYRRGSQEFTTVLKDMHITIALSGVMDIEKHKEKVNQKIHKIETEISLKEKMLSNKNFLQRAPSEIIEKEKEKLKSLKDEAQKLKGVRDGLR